jgi:hypothetical protein
MAWNHGRTDAHAGHALRDRASKGVRIAAVDLGHPNLVVAAISGRPRQLDNGLRSSDRQGHRQPNVLLRALHRRTLVQDLGPGSGFLSYLASHALPRQGLNGTET